MLSAYRHLRYCYSTYRPEFLSVTLVGGTSGFPGIWQLLEGHGDSGIPSPRLPDFPRVEVNRFEL